MVEPIRLEVKTYETMLADGERLGPIITRVVALHVAYTVMRDDGDSWDIPCEDVPGYLDLTSREQDFVRESAGELYSQWGPDSYLQEFVENWIADERLRAMPEADAGEGRA